MANLTITVASVAPGSTAQTANGIAGATITAGAGVYIDTANSNVIKPALATSLLASTLAGIALHGALTGQPITYIAAGTYTAGATVAVGTTYVVSATSGLLCPVADLASTNYVSHVGIATSTTVINVQRNNSGVQVP